MKSDVECGRCADRAAWLCLVGNILGCVLKAAIGMISGSLALVADAIHSGADVLVSIVTLCAVYLGKRPADKCHPYGHGKSEFISGAFVGLVLFVGSACIIVSALEHLLSKITFQPPHFIALPAAAISIVLNEMMFRYTHCAARRVNSAGLEALAWDNRSDAISSTPVFLGILGAQFGFPLLDPLAALLVGILVGKIGWEILAKNLGGLMDRPLHDEEMTCIKKVVLAVSGVQGISGLKTRSMGRDHFVDLEILVDAQTTVEKGNSIAGRVRSALRRKMSHMGNITICCRSKDKERLKT